MFKNFLEAFPNSAINNEVDRSIEDKSKVAEAVHAEEPAWRDEIITTTKHDTEKLKEVMCKNIPDNCINDEELEAVEHDPGDIADDEDGDDADEDEGHVELMSR